MARRLYALGLAGVALVAFVAEASPTPLVSPADAASWEGQAVAIRGVVRDVRPGGGVARFDLVLDGAAVAARLEGNGPAEGSHVEARGRLGRLGGVLTLLADRASPVDLGPALPVSVAALAQDPASWSDQPVAVRGVVEKGRLEGDGHAIALGSGEWPRAGAVEATVLLSYDARCACHRLDRVAWTS